MTRWRQWFFSALKVFFAGGLLIWFIRSGKVDFRSLGNLATDPFLILLILLSCLNFLFVSERWRTIMRAVGLGVGFWKTISLSLIGYFFNFFIPGGVSGDLVKAFYTTKEFPLKRGDAALSVFFDRVLGLYTMMLVAFLAMSFAFEYVRPSLTLVCMYIFMICCLVGGLTAYYLHEILDRLSGRFRLLRPFKKVAFFLTVMRNNPGRLTLAVVQSLLSQFFAITFFYLFAIHRSDFPADAAGAVFLFAVPVGFMATAIPISPGGIGVGQSAFYYLFELVLPGQGNVGALGFTLLQLTQFVLGLIGGGIFLGYRKRREPG